MTLPDSPKAPRILQQLHWIADPVGYMETTGKQYGDIFTSPVGIGIGKMLFVSNSQALQTILTNPKQFPAPGNLNQIFKPLLGSNSAILLDGQQHKTRRKLLMPPFHRERMQAYSQLILRHHPRSDQSVDG